MRISIKLFTRESLKSLIEEKEKRSPPIELKGLRIYENNYLISFIIVIEMKHGKGEIKLNKIDDISRIISGNLIKTI